MKKSGAYQPLISSLFSYLSNWLIVRPLNVKHWKVLITIYWDPKWHFQIVVFVQSILQSPCQSFEWKQCFFPFATFRRILKLFLEPPTFTILGLKTFLTSFFTTNTVMCNCIVWLVVNRKVVNHKGCVFLQILPLLSTRYKLNRDPTPILLVRNSDL